MGEGGDQDEGEREVSVWFHVSVCPTIIRQNSYSESNIMCCGVNIVAIIRELQ